MLVVGGDGLLLLFRMHEEVARQVDGVRSQSLVLFGGIPTS